MARRKTGNTVFDEAIDRMLSCYENQVDPIVAFSAGKDSTCILEICYIAAQVAGRLPLRVVMRDEEVMAPGTYEYAERVANRPGIEFHWLIAGQPNANIFNRTMPYFWPFDDRLTPDQWVRQPPARAVWIEDKHIGRMTTPERFPPREGEINGTVIGLRGDESRGRMLGIYSSGTFITRTGYGINPNTRNVFPIYDWLVSDVWKAIHENNWDYNRTYDIMLRMGIKPRAMRIAPPTMLPTTELLMCFSKAFPVWFDKVCERLPGVRQATLFGDRFMKPERHYKETWKQCYQRVCIDTAPGWIAERARVVAERSVQRHARHSSEGLPEVVACDRCGAAHATASWKNLTHVMYSGDPFAMKQDFVPVMEPEFFRPGSGTWGTKKVGIF